MVCCYEKQLVMKSMKSDAFFVDLECLVAETKVKKQSNKKGTALYIPITDSNHNKLKCSKWASPVQNQTFTKNDIEVMREVYKEKLLENKKEHTKSFCMESNIFEKTQIGNLPEKEQVHSQKHSTCITVKKNKKNIGKPFQSNLTSCSKNTSSEALRHKVKILNDYQCGNKEYVLPKLPKWAIQDGLPTDLDIARPFHETTLIGVLPNKLTKKYREQKFLPVHPENYFEIKVKGYISSLSENSIPYDFLPTIYTNNTLYNKKIKSNVQVAELYCDNDCSSDVNTIKSIESVQKGIITSNINKPFQLSTHNNLDQSFEDVEVLHLKENAKFYKKKSTSNLNPTVLSRNLENQNFINLTLEETERLPGEVSNGSKKRNESLSSVMEQSLSLLQDSSNSPDKSEIIGNKTTSVNSCLHSEVSTSISKDFKEMSNLLFQNMSGRGTPNLKEVFKTVDKPNRNYIGYNNYSSPPVQVTTESEPEKKQFSYYASIESLEDILQKEVVEWQKGFNLFVDLKISFI